MSNVWFRFAAFFSLAAASFVIHAASQPPPPAAWTRLYALRPTEGCAEYLMMATDPDVIADATTEVTALLRLSDPWIQNYLSLKTRPNDDRNRAFHVDVRLLALIYGDQPSLELKRANATSAFDQFERDMVAWPRLGPDARRAWATQIVDHVADLDWHVRAADAYATVYLDEFNIQRAFRGDALVLWASMVSRWWDVNDVDDVTLDAHRRIQALRTRLNQDPQLRFNLIERLKATHGPDNLPNVTLSARRFTRVFAEVLANEPKPDWSWIRNSLPRTPWWNPTLRR